MTKIYFFNSIYDPFLFGKYYYRTLFEILCEDKSYFYWCINNLPNFFISHEALQQIRDIFPKIIIPFSFVGHVTDNPWSYNDDEVYNPDNNHDEQYDYNESETFDRYNGSWAQDEMGYSDDDIDTIFDGDPSAYWNID